jgi:NAD(P)-dependent dehydrogenase (short-subunit alcohol dehydrogenase family)
MTNTLAHAERVAVVTGAAAGLGQAYAVRVAREGAKVVVADRDDGTDTVSAIREAGGEAHFVACDVSSEESVGELAARTTELVGRCDILINNAGVSPNVSWDDLTFTEWRRTLSINLDSMFLTCKAFCGGMREARFGRVVNISSNTFGLVIPGFVHYVASKGGVVGFTRALATDLGGYGITVNAVLPGLTQTATTMAMWEGTSLFADMAQQQAIQRPGVPADLEGVVSFLASEDARWVTGQTIVVDGGLVRH